MLASCNQGRNHGWKVEGDQGLGPNTGTLAPRAHPQAVLRVRGKVAMSRCVGPHTAYYPQFIRCEILHSGDYYAH